MVRQKPKRLVVPSVPPSSDTAFPVVPLLLDIPAAARVLSSTVWAVRSLLWSKELPFIKIGRKFLIDPTDLRAFVEKQKTAVL
jgi:excisionase family DNA binding protein